MIILLNLSTCFVNFKLSKTRSLLETRLAHKYWYLRLVDGRDIYIALIVTAIFILFTEYLFNEDSEFCVFSEEFKDYHNAKQT